jgi:hypothetical protein
MVPDEDLPVLLFADDAETITVETTHPVVHGKSNICETTKIHKYEMTNRTTGMTSNTLFS